jgi:L-threonylcarbamoyladenylate synthase
MPQGLLSVMQAAGHLNAGEVIAYPTEAVYGLGCDPENEAAVSQIFRLKHRSPSAGLILITDYFDRVSDWVGDIDSVKLKTVMDSWPGPVTWLFPRSSTTPPWLTGDHPRLAIRVTAHPVCRELCATFGGAIVSTSANVSGEPPARTEAEVRKSFLSGIAGIVAGDPGEQTNPSEIRDLETGRVLRRA